MFRGPAHEDYPSSRPKVFRFRLFAPTGCPHGVGMVLALWESAGRWPLRRGQEMLKIVVESRDGASFVRAEGQMIGPWVNELRRSLEELVREGVEPIVDLNGVSFVDREGVHLLRSLGDRGVAVVNSSSFVAAQLKG